MIRVRIRGRYKEAEHRFVIWKKVVAYKCVSKGTSRLAWLSILFSAGTYIIKLHKSSHNFCVCDFHTDLCQQLFLN